MREFFDPGVAAGTTIEVTPAPAYAEFECPLPDGGGLIAYLTVDDERFRLWSTGTPTACSFTIQTCVDELLTPYFTYMQDSVHGNEWAAVFFAAFPVLKQLYDDSQADRLDNGGIRWVDDPDVSENKYMIVVAVDDLAWDADNWATPYRIERLRHGLVRALERSLALARDLQDNTVHAFAQALELGVLGGDPGQLTGLQRYQALNDAASKIKDWADFLRKLADPLSG